MGQKKLIRFAAIRNFSNVLEYPVDIAGAWNTKFENNNPIVLELACGRGEYTVGLAELNKEQNFIGIDIKGNRMYIGAKKALSEGLINAMFLRSQIENITDSFSPGEVDEIWITFPDPQLRTSRAKKRLTHPRFLRLYQKVLKRDGIIHLKTDSPALYQFTLQVINMYGLNLIESFNNVYAETEINPTLKIKTFYESLDIAGSNKIFYLKFSLPEEIKNFDEELQKLLKETEHSN
jgi:tRNA (guanine-N7-)-methyltransferase